MFLFPVVVPNIRFAEGFPPKRIIPGKEGPARSQTRLHDFKSIAFPTHFFYTCSLTIFPFSLCFATDTLDYFFWCFLRCIVRHRESRKNQRATATTLRVRKRTEEGPRKNAETGPKRTLTENSRDVFQY